MRKTFPLALNSILFIAGIGFLSIQHPILCAVCFLLISLLFVWTFSSRQTPEPLSQDESLPEDTSVLSAMLSHQIEELTESNQQLSAENQRLADALKQFKKEPSEPSGVLYTCPLTSALPVHLDTFFTDYLNCHAERIEGRKLYPDYNCAASDAVTYLSSAALTIICNNIFDNMLKFSPRAESIYIRITVIEEDSLIIFKNEGDGPAESELEKLFDLNYQGANRKSGCGLGLAQVKALVDDFGGHIWAKSTKGTGFALYIQLPEKSVDKDSVTQP